MKCLVIRMSSLGDIILATSFLENLPEDVIVDWVVASEFKFVLEGHPKINRLIAFKKKSGLKGWIQLVLELSQNNYDVRVDLHSTLRSRIAFFLFRLIEIGRAHWKPAFSVSKERLKTSFYLIFKSLTPKFFLPTPYWKRFGKIGQSISKRSRIDLKPPSYLPILSASLLNEADVLQRYALSSKRFFAIMPASRWSSKEWAPHRYLELIIAMMPGELIPVLMGRATDFACVELKALLDLNKIPYRSTLAEPDFKKTAVLLKSAKFYIGSDTGLSHLAEAVGTPSFVLFGPTQSDLGFGPWRKESQAISLNLSCSPCSKDGSFCYRFFDPYACLKKMDVQKVQASLR